MKDPVELMRQLNKSLQRRNQAIHNRLLGIDTPYVPANNTSSEEHPNQFHTTEEATPADAFGLSFFLLDESPPQTDQAWVQQTAELARSCPQTRKTCSTRGMPQPNSEQLAAAAERVEALKSYFAQLKPKPIGYMLCFVMYDIEDNRIRKKIADYLVEKGLQRIQKSVFLGQLSQKVYQEIYQTMHALQAAYENEDTIIIVPVAEQDLRSMRLIGREIDMEITLGRANTLFF
ncbi:MAG: CRISPR-associated endonuclease Cas2 [Cytophagales bacterium]|nr:CRISPR-associated endonuclease Cas2 [Bernardetiaceae bacterium]MDW8203931.1 CRISPR-associated endonuclease Cas2 [Cytophagales bacterium]